MDTMITLFNALPNHMSAPHSGRSPGPLPASYMRGDVQGTAPKLSGPNPNLSLSLSQLSNLREGPSLLI